MIKAFPRPLGVLAVAVAATATMGVSTATAAPAATTSAGTTTASVQGWARLDWFHTPDNDLQFTVDAHAVYTSNSRPFPVSAWGTARIYHRFDDATGKPLGIGWADLKVDCLSVGGPTATVTGIAVRTSDSLKDWMDKRIGASIYDGGKGGRSRVGFSGVTKDGDPLLPKCMAPAATFPVQQGGYTLKDTSP